jgi:hypothetical protein
MEEKRNRSRYAGKYYDWIYDYAIRFGFLDKWMKQEDLGRGSDNFTWPLLTQQEIRDRPATPDTARRDRNTVEKWYFAIIGKKFWKKDFLAYLSAENRTHQLRALLERRHEWVIGRRDHEEDAEEDCLSAMEENLEIGFWLWRVRIQ